MVIGPDRLEQLHLARLESRLRPFERIIEQVESQIDHDLRGGWGDVDDHIPDPQDPRRVQIHFTTELDSDVEEALAALTTEERTVVEQEIRRLYLAAGYRSLTFLDRGRVRLEHVVGTTAHRSEPTHEADPGPGSERVDTR